MRTTEAQDEYYLSGDIERVGADPPAGDCLGGLIPTGGWFPALFRLRTGWFVKAIGILIFVVSASSGDPRAERSPLWQLTDGNK
jgi:hypothetical protein